MTEPLHVILDETAMVAAGCGNRVASELIHYAHDDQGWRLYAPTCALVEADRLRPGTAEHIAGLPGLEVVDLNLPAALAVARGAGWAQAHAEYASMPTPEIPNGAFIATTEPKRWEGRPVRVVDLNP